MGFARELFPDPDLSEEFICSICHDVLEDPLVINDCEHIYCGPCIKDWCESNSICPMDRKPVQVDQLRHPQRSFLNLVNGLKRRCDFAENGCADITALGDRRVHEVNCPANPEYKSECEHGCGTKLSRNEIQNHSCILALKTQLATMRVELQQIKMESDNTKDRLRVLEKLLLDRPFDQEMQDWITQMCYDVLQNVRVPNHFRNHSRADSVENVWNPFASLPPHIQPQAFGHHSPAQLLKQHPIQPPASFPSWQDQLDLVRLQDIIQQRLLNKYGGNWFCQVKPCSYEFRKAVVCTKSSTLEFCVLNYEIVIRRA